MTPLRCPLSGAALRPDSPHSLGGGGTRWPVIDGIPFLRAGREALAREALSCLDRGEADRALALLLGDQDDWWRGAAPDRDAVGDLVRRASSLSLREAMDRLGWGPVGLYFAHRWSDPTFVAGLALVEAHWNAPRRAFELACGIGHHLRELGRRGVAVTGGDVVFAKLWIARHFVAQDAELVCFDAAHPWPVEGRRFDLALCHDAFYFLEPKHVIADRLRRAAGDGGMLAIGHVHNRDWPNLSAGSAMTSDEVAALFPDAVVYDDAELTTAAIEARVPHAAPADRRRGAEAFSLVVAPPAARTAARAIEGFLVLPPRGAALRRNPLYGDGGDRRFPSARYAREYGDRATYRTSSDCPAVATADDDTAEWARRRELVDLPDRW